MGAMWHSEQSNSRRVNVLDMSKGSTLRRFGVSMGEDLLDRFDELIAHKSYETQSEAISDLVRRALADETLADESAEVVATISLVYDHHVPNLNARGCGPGIRS